MKKYMDKDTDTDIDTDTEIDIDIDMDIDIDEDEDIDTNANANTDPNPNLDPDAVAEEKLVNTIASALFIIATIYFFGLYIWSWFVVDYAPVNVYGISIPGWVIMFIIIPICLYIGWKLIYRMLFIPIIKIFFNRRVKRQFKGIIS